MGVFRFHLIGGRAPIVLEVAASTASDLHEVMARNRFVQGHAVEADGDGVLAEMLIATSRIECVCTVD